MKNVIIYILLLIIYSCAKSNCNTQSYDCQKYTRESVNEVLFESIDTAEFIVYWEQFRKAILEQDTITLSTMINDSVDGGWFLLRDHNENVNKISKSFLMDSLFVLFTPEFITLLKSYEIGTYLGANRENILWKKAEKKTYKSHIQFAYVRPNENKADYYNVAFYEMSWKRDKEDLENYVMQRMDDELDLSTVKQILKKQDFECLDHLIFRLMFVKSSIGIKLYAIELSYPLDIFD